MSEFSWGWFFGIYLPLAVLAYYVMYANAVDLSFRLNVQYREGASVWGDFLSDQKGVLRLLAMDFLKIHCPWSKQTSIRYRVQEAHEVLQSAPHEKGWKPRDCHNPANHAQIAKDCFKSRTRFWVEQFLVMLTSPLRILALVAIAIIATVAYPIYLMYCAHYNKHRAR